MPRLALKERFWSKVDTSGECWLWVGTCKPNGYGEISIKCKNRMTHRVAWELTYGPIPDSLLDTKGVPRDGDR